MPFITKTLETGTNNKGDVWITKKYKVITLTAIDEQ